MESVNIKMGGLVRIENTCKPKFSNAKSQYLAVQVEDPSGKELCLLFTQKDIDAAEFRASRNKKDLAEKGFFSNVTN